ncbi:MAG: alpha/beta hydrolase-fold protein [Planctomycetota bacterium]
MEHRPRSRPSLLLPALVAAIAAGGAAAQSRSASLDSATKKKVTALTKRFWEARPRSHFVEWDPQVRAAILAEAAAVALPDGALAQVMDILWKPARKEGPRFDSTKPHIDTPYGDARLILRATKKKGRGLVLGLHGGGEGAGDAGEAAGSWILDDCVGMYPQGIELVHDTWNTVHGERFLLTLIEIAKAQHDVDPDRVYVMGFSMGGTGSWFMAGRHTDLFAGASPCAGVIMAAPKSQVARAADVQALQHGLIPNVRNLAMYSYIGLADRNCMPGTFLAAWDRIEQLRKDDPGGYENIRFTTYEGLGHEYPPGEPRNGLQWISAQRRVTFPTTVVWEYVADPQPAPDDHDKVARYRKTDFYWLHCEEPVDNQRLRASIADNVVTLDGTLAPEFRGVSILLNDTMIDADREVVVRAGDHELYRGKPAPEFGTVLAAFDARFDRSMAFDRRIDL